MSASPEHAAATWPCPLARTFATTHSTFEIAYAMKVHAYEAKMAEEGNRPPLGTHWSAPSHGTLTPRAEVQRRRAEIMALYDAGTPPQQIAEQLNLPLSVVYNDTYAARMNRK